MPDHAPAAALDSSNPSQAVWQEYPVSVFGDAMRAVAVLLPSVALGGGLAVLLDLTVQLGFAGVLGQWIPSDDVEAFGISAMLVALLLPGLALAAPLIPGQLAQWSVDRALLRAAGDGAPRTQVPHPVQQSDPGGYWGWIGLLFSLLVGLVAGSYLLVRIISDPSRPEFWRYGGIVLGYAVLCAAVLTLLSAARRRAVAQRARSGGKRKNKKRIGLATLHRAYWSKAYCHAVWAKAARAAGYESIDAARRVVKEAEAEENAKHTARIRPPQLGGGGLPLPTGPGANEPEWALRDQPPGMWAAIRTRWGALLCTWAALLLGAWVANWLFGEDGGARQDLGWHAITVGVVTAAMLIAAFVALTAEVVLAVVRTVERVRLFSAAADPSSARPAEGVLVRGSAPRRLGLARTGALLVGLALPFVIAAVEATGDQGSWFMAHADAVDVTLWACIALFTGCVLVQAVEYHYGRSARSSVMARWPSLWQSRDLTGW